VALPLSAFPRGRSGGFGARRSLEDGNHSAKCASTAHASRFDWTHFPLDRSLAPGEAAAGAGSWPAPTLALCCHRPSAESAGGLRSALPSSCYKRPETIGIPQVTLKSVFKTPGGWHLHEDLGCSVVLRADILELYLSIYHRYISQED
jgi:hypothetical protein